MPSDPSTPAADIQLVYGTDVFDFPFGLSVGIQKEFVRSDDGSVISEKHSISIRGVYALDANENDPLVSYKTLMQKVQERVGVIYRSLSTNDRRTTLQTDRLQLLVSGADAFNDQYQGAVLTGVNFSEPGDDTGGFQYQEVAFTFECNAVGSNDLSTKYSLKSAAETFEIKREDDQIFFGNIATGKFTGDETDKTYFTFTITHTLSAQGNVKYTASNKNEAFNEAYKYVCDKKKKSIFNTVILEKDINDKYFLTSTKISNQNMFKIEGGDAVPKTDDVGYDLTNYKEWNLATTESIDVAGGQYSYTRTYTYNPASYTIELTGSYEKSEEGVDSLRVEGTLNGMFKNTGKPYQNYHDKFDNARSGLVDIVGTGKPFASGTPIYNFAQKLYARNAYTPFYSGVFVLDERPIASTLSENRITGAIQFSVSYKPIPAAILELKKQIPNCISIAVNINDSNPYHSGIPDPKYQMKTVVPVPILGRAVGPIIQNMSTTQQSERTVALEATVDVAERTPDSQVLASGVKLVIDTYAPNRPNTYLTEITDTYDWSIGKLSVNAKWIYTR